MKPETSSIVVTGDIVLDRHIYGGERYTLGDHSARGTHMKEEPGGAVLTCRLIKSVLAAKFGATPLQPEQKADADWEWPANNSAESAVPKCGMGRVVPKDARDWPERLIGYAWWEPFQLPEGEDRVWRVSKPLGYGPPGAVPATLPSKDKAAATSTPFFKVADGLPPAPNILVLDDAGDLFRRQQQSGLWLLPDDTATDESLPEWIVLKLAGSIGQGALWDRLSSQKLKGRLVTLASARLFRQNDVRLSQGLSWERSVEHLMHELKHNPAVRRLCESRHLIINFGIDGAVWVDFEDPEQPKARLVFDAANAEGEWSSHIKGHVFGYLSCLTAAVVQTLVSPRDNALDFEPAIERGLSAMRNLLEEGHGVAVSAEGDFSPGAGFPVKRLADAILCQAHRFARAAVPVEAFGGAPVQWSVLASLQKPLVPERQLLYGFARRIALRGLSVLSQAPHLRMGKLISAGREEMETLRSLRRILRAYRDTSNGKKPLSIGVFGTPGSGKSFGVEQLALAVFGNPDKGSYEGWKEFNLSQFDKPEDLIGAFHQVRDLVLQGLTPVVFWDEFDSREYKWLQYLLAPMQDGRFQQGQITHTLGKCVFIFAGGTAETFEELRARAGRDPDNPHPEEVVRSFRLAKGPDFMSRLDGYLNVLGPNQRLLPPDADGKRAKDPSDIFFPVRRALIIRNALDCKADNEPLEIDEGALTALLEVGEYKHGARSLNKLLEPLAAARKMSNAPLRRSQLPAPNQLSLHVNADDFYTICAQDMPFKPDEIISRLAPAIHENWRAIDHAEGRTPRYDMPFEDLPPDIKRANMEAARRIPKIIALVGLRVVERGTRPAAEPLKVRERLDSHLEALAEEEHNHWMEERSSEGWRYAEQRNDELYLHDCLLEYKKLRESDKEKDRVSVRNYPAVVDKAGYELAFT
ncbi:MAG TPA: RyR domain-containing protein [Pyrinomonadaceae bacterium]|jgi:hypothetical protein|nr:RyR domain-containing protein [Pyrinomonadaceae bacterium]